MRFKFNHARGECILRRFAREIDVPIRLSDEGTEVPCRFTQSETGLVADDDSLPVGRRMGLVHPFVTRSGDEYTAYLRLFFGRDLGFSACRFFSPSC